MNDRCRLHSPVALALSGALLFVGCSKGETGEAPAQQADAAAPAPAAASAPAAAPASPSAAALLPPAGGAAPAPAPAPAAPPAAAEPGAATEMLSPDSIPEVVARVDGREITREDLLTRAAEARGALAERGVPPPPPTREFFRRVLDDLIGNSLLYRELAGQGKNATEAEIDQQVAAIRGQFTSDADFDQALAARGFDRVRLRREIGESLTVKKWVDAEVAPSASPTESEAREFYARNEAQMVDPERARVRHILLKVDAGATPEQKAEKRRAAEALRARIAGGADFAAVAGEASDDPGSKGRGGELGWVLRGQTVPPFEQAAFSLEPGVLSEPIETRFGYHLVEVQERRAEAKLGFEEVRPRIDEMLRQRKIENAVRAKLNELGAKAKVEILI